MNKTVYALFRDHDEAHYALQDLLSNGFSKDSINLAIHQTEVEPGSTGTLFEGGAAAGLGAGLVSGSVLGGILGVLSVFILPTGLILAGPIAWTLAGAVSGGTTGTLIGALIGFGIPKDQADYYAEGVRRGGTLLVVGVDDNTIELAESILDRDGAIDIRSLAETFQKEGFQEFEEDGRLFTKEEVAQTHAQKASLI